MATKANPGTYDCYAAAEPDEPLFVLLARDPSAPYLVAAWADLRAWNLGGAVSNLYAAAEALKRRGKPVLPYGSEKVAEAYECSRTMFAWEAARAADPGLAKGETPCNPTP